MCFNMINKISNLFNIFTYEDNKEYYIDINKIKVPYDFELSSPRYTKFKQKENMFKNNGIYSPIILNHDFVIKDGYITYLLFKKYNYKKAPVIFTNE